jgi:hypothetical protein
MALKAEYEIRCPCGTTFTGEVCEYVFVEHDPHLKDAILSGEFNRVTCPSCGRGLPVENRYLYRDEKNRLWVWVCGKEEEPRRAELAEELIEKNAVIESHFLDEVGEYRKFLVFGRNALIGLLLEEDRDLKRNERKTLTERPALRCIPPESDGPGYLFLRGNKVRVAIPLKYPADPESMPVSSEGRKRWLHGYSQGLNLHNPCSSLLDKGLRLRWNRIRQQEAAGRADDEFEDFAASWAGYKLNRRELRARYPRGVRSLKA